MEKLIDILRTIGVIMVLIGLPVCLFIDIPKQLMALALIFMLVSLIYDEINDFKKRRDSI